MQVVESRHHNQCTELHLQQAVNVKHDVGVLSRCPDNPRSGEYMSADYAQQNEKLWAAFVPPSGDDKYPLPPVSTVLVSLILLALLFAAASVWTVHRVETRLGNSVRAGLEANGINAEPFKLDWHYRDLTVTGQSAGDVTDQQLTEVITAAGGGGIRNINLSLTEPVLKSEAVAKKKGSVDVQMNLIDGKITLTGIVLTASQRQQLIDAASAAVGIYNVDTDLDVSGLQEANPGSDERIQSFANSMTGLDKAIVADAELSATDFRFNATVADESQVDELLKRRGTAGDLGLVISGDIIARKSVPGGEVSVNALLSNGRVVLNGVVANQQQKDLLLSSAVSVVDLEHVVDEIAVATGTDGSGGGPELGKEALKKVQIAANAIELFADTLEADVSLNSDTFAFNALLEFEENTTELMVIREQAAEMGLEVEGSIESRQMSLGREVLLLQSEIDLLTDEIRNSVVFDRADAQLTFDAKKTLDKMVDAMNRYPRAVVEISGHTDNMGDEQTNALLSLDRAIIVREYLQRSGIDETRLRALGRGESSPIASNKTEIGKKNNRRVEFVALGEFEY